jgi:hypothetical protein
MRPRPLIILSIGAIVFAAGCSSSSTGSKGSNGIDAKSGSQIVAAAVAATKRQTSFHFVESQSSGTSGVLIAGDVGTSAGEQHITIRDGKKKGHLTVLLADKTAYLQGDLYGLEGFTGLSAKLSSEFAGKWISVASTSSSFAELVATLEVSKAATQLVSLPGTLTRGANSVRLGHPAVAVKAAQTSSAGSLKLTLYVATKGASLPILVEGTTAATKGAARSVLATFSDWGEAVHVSAPGTSLPIAMVQALAR